MLTVRCVACMRRVGGGHPVDSVISSLPSHSLGAKTFLASVAEVMGVESRALSPIRDRLLRSGTVQVSEHGRLSFTVPGFAEYVLELGE